MKLEAIICMNRVHMYYTELFKNEDGKIMCVTKEYEEDGETLVDRHSFVILDKNDNWTKKTNDDVLAYWSGVILQYYHMPIVWFRDLAYHKMTAVLYPCNGKILDG